MAGLPYVPSTAPPSEDRPTPEALETIKDIPVFDAQGKQVPFQSLYEVTAEERAARGDVLTMVIFIRHFYCSVCQAYVTGLVDEVATTPQKKIIIVGCGAPELISAYAKETNCSFPIYAEPTQKLYSILGMVKTLNPGAKPKFLKDYGMLGLLAKPFSQILSWGGALKGGDIQQVGGEFLFVNGECVWCHRMKTTRDHIEIDDLKKVMGIVGE